MASKNPIILLLEDCPTTGLLIERGVLNHLSTCRLIWARTVREARQRCAGIPISLFIIDVILPDGSGLEFLEQVADGHPLSAAIVITSTPLPAYRAMSAALGVLNFMEKPLVIPTLIEQIESALGSHQAAASGRDFRATLDNVTALDILQLKCLSAASTVIEFRSNAEVGTIRLHKGEVVDASTGALRGIEAVRQIIGWPHGRVQEHVEIGEFVRTIDCSWQALLMEVARYIDENEARAAIA